MPEAAHFVLVILQTFAAAALATWGVRYMARRRGWLAPTRPDRWHREPTALYGGVGIFIGFAAGLAWFVPWTPFTMALLALTAVMFLTGLVDDAVDIRPQTKVVLQLCGGLLLYAADFHFNDGFAWWLDMVIVVVWVVAITNAMNLLDNMNGLAAGTAVIAGVSRLLSFVQVGNVDGALASAVFVGAVLGFLVFNFPRASIFMGDGGSFTIGFALAALNLTNGQGYSKSLFSIFVFPVLALALPIFDTAFVSVVRYVSGRAISQGGRDHTSHRLVAIGLSETVAVVILWTISAGGGLMAYFLYNAGLSRALFAAGILLLALALFGVVLARVRVYHEGAELDIPETASGFALPGEVLYKRQILWVLLDGMTVTLALGATAGLTLPAEPLMPGTVWVPPPGLPVAVAAVMLGLFAAGLYRADGEQLGLPVVARLAVGAMAGLVAVAALQRLTPAGSLWPVASLAMAAVVVSVSVCVTRLVIRTFDRWLHERGYVRG